MRTRSLFIPPSFRSRVRRSSLYDLRSTVAAPVPGRNESRDNYDKTDSNAQTRVNYSTPRVRAHVVSHKEKYFETITLR